MAFERWAQRAKVPPTLRRHPGLNAHKGADKMAAGRQPYRPALDHPVAVVRGNRKHWAIRTSADPKEEKNPFCGPRLTGSSHPQRREIRAGHNLERRSRLVANLDIGR